MADTLQQLLRERADDDTVAVKYGDRTWTWREHVAEAPCRGGRPDRPRRPRPAAARRRAARQHPGHAAAMAAAALGGYVLCGINTTRRGDGLPADVRRADCQILVTDAEHRHLLDGLDLPDVRVLDTSSPEWAALVAEPGADAAPRGRGDGHVHDDLHLGHQRRPQGRPGGAPDGALLRAQPGRAVRSHADDVCYVSMPLFHSNAVVAGWAVALASGRRDGAGEVLGVAASSTTSGTTARRT